MEEIVRCPKCDNPYSFYTGAYFGDQSKCKDCRSVNESGKAFVYNEETASKQKLNLLSKKMIAERY